jgi:hypothetical protein
MSEVSSIGVWMLTVGLTTLTAASAQAVVDRVSARARARRAAERAHSMSVAEVRAGEIARVTGRLSFAEPAIQAPFSGRSCAHFEACVSSRHPRGYRRRVSTHRTRDFFVRDESGQIFVDTQRAIVDVVHDHHWWSREMDVEDRFEIEHWLYQNGPAWSRLVPQKDDLRYSEGALTEGEIVTVVGLAKIERDATHVLYRDGPRRLALVAPRRGHVFVADDLHVT